MNAKEIDKNKVFEFKCGLAPLRVKAWVFILQKVIACLDLECYHPVFNKGCWGLDTCDHLIGGLRGCII